MSSRRTQIGTIIILILFFAPTLGEVQAQGILQRVPSLRSIPQRSPNPASMSAHGYYRLGVGNLREPSTTDRAVEQLERAVELEESNAEYHYMLAEAYMTNYQAAGFLQLPFVASNVRKHLELAVRYSPSTVEYREALLQYYVIAPAILGGSFTRAYEQAAEISKLDPYLGLLARAGIYAEEGEQEKAVELFQKAIRVLPKGWQAYQRLGSHYLGAQDGDRAIEMFKKYVDVAPEQAESHRHLGMAYQQKRMYHEAIGAFQRALDRDPTMAPLVFRIAQLYEFQGDSRKASEHYQRYLSMIPNGRAADDARLKLKGLGK